MDAADRARRTRAGREATVVERRVGAGEILVALACFVALCGVALSYPTRLVEHDAYAYRASIAALSHGHVTLSNDQNRELRDQLIASDGGNSTRRSLPRGQTRPERPGPDDAGARASSVSAREVFPGLRAVPLRLRRGCGT